MVVPSPTTFHSLYSPTSNCDTFEYDRFFSDVNNETDLVFQTVMNRRPYPFQSRIRRTLAAMSHSQHHLSKASILLVALTGDGKSSVRDAHAFITGGVTLTIVPLLSLGVDQSEKVKQYPSNKEKGIINTIHLDDYRTDAQRRLTADLMKVKWRIHQRTEDVAHSPIL